MKAERNPGCELDLGWINSVNVNFSATNQCVYYILDKKELRENYLAAWLLRAVTCIDLTTLAGDDTQSNIARLCRKAARPLNANLLEKFGFDSKDDSPITTAAVCVYPSRVSDAVQTLKSMNFYGKVNVASVATGFPCGQTSLKIRLDEIKYAVEQGATEIDIVINRTLVINGQWELLYQEIQQMKEACGPNVHMKSILAVGELGNYDNIYKASLVAMMAGSDFIKTSTGKETVNATLPVGLVMARAIKEYYNRVGYKVGLKPAGGIKTSEDAVSWLILIKCVLGTDWLNRELFRFGASGLLGHIETNLYDYANKC